MSTKTPFPAGEQAPQSSQESLEIITRMIAETRQGIAQGDGFLPLLWGYLVLTASLIHYTLLTVESWGLQKIAPVAWMLMIVGSIVTVVWVKKHASEQKVETYIDHVMRYLWIGFSVCLFITLAMWSKLGLGTYPVVMMFYGIGMFVTGGLLKERTTIILASLVWVVAVVAFFLDFREQLLALAVAITLGYIIPGHIITAKARNSHV